MSSTEFGKEVLRAEIQALENMASLLDENFSKAVELILQCQGNVVITGVGKPWLIGQKISATMASTGTPSIALHPTEAAHGDLGRIRERDLVIAMSNSGASEEVLRLLPILKREGVTIIGVTGNLESELARHSDVILNLGKVNEACPLKLAPSASTTAMLALGDALALTVMEERGFEANDYARFHPAGALGRRLMPVQEMMRPLAESACIKPTANVKDALFAMTKVKSGLASIIDESGKLLGVFTEGDLRRLVQRDDAQLSATIDQVMISPGIRISPSELCDSALHLMESKRIAELPVVDTSGNLLGHLQLKDLVKSGIV